MPQFPSVAWFDAVRNAFNRNPSYRGGGGGRCDCLAGVKVDNRVFMLNFDGFECSGVDEVTQTQLTDADFYMAMKAPEWEEMLENIKQHGHAVDRFTLNTLDLDRVDGLATSTHGDQYREDMFFRYNQTLQYFFDASSQIKTTYRGK